MYIFKVRSGIRRKRKEKEGERGLGTGEESRKRAEKRDRHEEKRMEKKHNTVQSTLEEQGGKNGESGQKRCQQ
jgi:hypothetical protein